MAKQAVIVYGGFKGHTPEESAEVFQAVLQADGYDVHMRDTLEAYADPDLMGSVDLIVPCWTMGELTGEQSSLLSKTVRGGVGLAGFHGGIIDSFRKDTNYQWMTGGQWVAHPGNCETKYTVDIVDTEHEITQGLEPFVLEGTEQYYLHVDPAIHVLCQTTFAQKFDAVADLYPQNTVMPYAWTRRWGQGRVFVAAWGHTFKDFDVPQAKEIVRRGMHWATR